MNTLRCGEQARSPPSQSAGGAWPLTRTFAQWSMTMRRSGTAAASLATAPSLSGPVNTSSARLRSARSLRSQTTAASSASGDFSQNVMYVTGTVDSAVVEGETIRLTGNSECTGIGVGSNLPFTATIRKGGPGATLILRGGNPPQIFREILLDGLFDIPNDK